MLIAQQTIFGWVLIGPVSTVKSHIFQSHHCSIDHELHDLLSKFWSQEELPTLARSQMTADEEACEQHFRSTHSRDDTGRYVVRLLLKSSPNDLEDSQKKARACLKQLFSQFKTKPAFHQLYHEFLTEYERLGHMVKVDNDEHINLTVHYLPHHGVLRESSLTTKLRVVFNGSSRTSSGKSINDILYPVPNYKQTCWIS